MKGVLLLFLFVTSGALAQGLPDLDQVHGVATKERSATVSAVSPKVQEAADANAIAAYRQRTEAFAWQAFASKIIFWVVVVLVVSGIAFSGIQFWFGLRRGTTAESEELDLSVEGVKVRSQFLGVVTLALSLAFFYLYLKTVYPIVEVGDKSESQTSSHRQ